MKSKKLTILALVGIMSISLNVFAYANNGYDNLPSEPTVITDVLPTNQNTRVTGTKTTSTLPKNVDGNQGTSVYTATIGSSDLNASYEVKVSGFSNSMKSVNVSVYAGITLLSNQMDMSSVSTVTVKIPSNASGETFKIVMSTNSTNRGTCDLTISSR